MYNGNAVFRDFSPPWAAEAGQSLLYRRHYGYGSVRCIIHDLLSVSGVCMYNFCDDGAIATLQLWYSLLQNANLTLYARGFMHPFFPSASEPAHDLEGGGRLEILF